MKVKKPSGNPIANRGLDKAALDKAGPAKTKTQPVTQKKVKTEQNTFEQKSGAADRPGVDFTQTGGKDPFKGGPLIAVNPMPEPTPSVEPSVNPLPDTAPTPEPSVNPLPEPEPEIAVNPMPEPEPAVEPSVNPLPEPEPTVEPSVNPLPDTEG